MDTLKRKQKELNHQCFRNSFPNNNNNKDQSLNDCNQHLNVSLKKDYYDIDDDNNMSLLSWNQINERNNNNNKKSSNKFVRINSAKSNTLSMRSNLSYTNLKHNCDDLSVDTPDSPKKFRSKSSSPIRLTPRLTVPKPFKMTQRYYALGIVKIFLII